MFSNFWVGLRVETVQSYRYTHCPFGHAHYSSMITEALKSEFNPRILQVFNRSFNRCSFNSSAVQLVAKIEVDINVVGVVQLPQYLAIDDLPTLERSLSFARVRQQCCAIWH